MYGDPEQIRGLARQAAGMADELRAEATAVARLTGVQWVSTSASSWRDEVDELVARMRHDADEVDQAAEALFTHADAAEATLQRISSAMAAFDDLVSEARTTLAEAADDAGDAAVGWARGVVDSARRAPSALSLDWLSW